MTNLLHQLENNEAILLMYIAGELPEEERREVAQMLASDASLRALHEELREALSAAMVTIERVDDGDPPTLSREVAARQVGRMVRQWHARRLAAPAVLPAQPASRRIPRWVQASAVAAVLAVGLIAWWGFVSDGPVNQPAPGPVATSTDPTAPLDPNAPVSPEVAHQDTPDPTTTDISPSPNPGDALALADTPDSAAGDLSGFASPALSDLERQAKHLRDLSPDLK
jgi:anti-sigma factor RsiW